VAQGRDDFPAELRERATSLAIAGAPHPRELVAAAFLNALEPLWDAYQEGDARATLDAWEARAGIRGRALTAHTPGGEVTGEALGLADDGALLLRTASGTVRVVAGDVVAPHTGARP